MFGFYRLAAAVPVIRVADVEFNLSQMLECYREACVKQAAAVVFPELSVTGYSCGDLFFQERLLERAESAAAGFAKATAGQGTVAIFGFPLKFGEGIYNVAAVAQNGMIRGLVPKSLLPNYREFYEKRHFRSGAKVAGELVRIDRRPVPFGSDLWFDGGRGFRFAVELCEDLWGVRPPSSGLALAGARAIFNLSAGTELASKAAYRRDLVKQQSARCLAAYVLASAGVHESTSDVVFGGHALIADNGRLAAENRRFDRGNSMIYADVDFGRLGAARCSESSFNDNEPLDRVYRRVELEEAAGSPDLEFAYNPPRPFVPEGAADRRERCLEIFDIQCAGLAKRIEHTHAKTMVIGISGGLDSTLALLVAAECCKLLGRPASALPGAPTTTR